MKRKAFAVTPDPRFLYESPSHREALASLTYGIREQRGFIGLVGEAGTGKSTVLRAFLDRLGDSARTALVTHTTLSPVETMGMILYELAIPQEGLSRLRMLQSLNEFAVAELEARRPPPVIIVDEAQNLSHEVLEEIRLLTNLEISDRKLVQVILAGQPELEQRLQHRGLRQLRQRISLYVQLCPLNSQEVAEYVMHRLRVAGCWNVGLFSRDALYIIWRASGGIPRLVNMICEQSLVNAYGVGKSLVDTTIALEAANDVKMGVGGSSFRKWLWGRSLSNWVAGRGVPR